MPRRPDEASSLPKTTLSVYQGDDKRWLFRLKTKEKKPFDLTGYTAAVQFRTTVADQSVVATDLATEIVDGPSGEITVVLSSAQSVALMEDHYLWDLQIMDADAWTTTIAGGDVVVTREITRLA